MPKKKRLYSKREPLLPVPSYRKNRTNSFPLRTIEAADKRFTVVKELRARLERLKEDAGVESLQREWLAARAVFLVARIESLEHDSVCGIEMNWKEYLMATRALTDVLKNLGLDKAVAGAQRLETYLLDARKQKNGKHKVRN